MMPGAPNIFAGLGALKSKPVKAVKKESNRTPFQRHPRHLRVKLIEAIQRLEAVMYFHELGTDWHRALGAYRGHLACGIVNPMFVQEHRGHHGYLEALTRLDEAFNDMHEYRPEDHLAEGVYRLAQAKNGSAERNRDIMQALLDKGVLDKSPKEAARAKRLVAEQFGVNIRSIHRVVERLEKNK